MKMLNSKSNSFNRTALTVLGVLLISFGIAWMRFSQMGTDPFVTMNIGISKMISMDFGLIQMLANIFLLVVMMKFTPKLIHLGTILGIFVVGYLSDFLLAVIEFLPATFFVQLLAMCIGLFFCCFGVAVYMTADMGIAPYDALGMILEKKLSSRLTYKELRVITDICCVAVGFLCGAPIGLGTVITAFFTGPLINMFKNIIQQYGNRKHKEGVTSLEME